MPALLVEEMVAPEDKVLSRESEKALGIEPADTAKAYASNRVVAMMKGS